MAFMAAMKNPLSVISPVGSLLAKKSTSSPEKSLLNTPTSVGSTSKSSIMY